MSRKLISIMVLVLFISGSPLMALLPSGGEQPQVSGLSSPAALAHVPSSPYTMSGGISAPYAQVPAERLVSRSSRAGPDVTPKDINFTDTDKCWFGHSVGTVGVPTKIYVNVSNVGDTNATNVDVRIDIKDFFGDVIDTFTTMVADIPPTEVAEVTWPDWTPTVSQKISATVTATVAGDADPTNDAWSFYGDGWWVDKWLDMANSESGWTGDITTNKWHTTAKVEGDPNNTQHSDAKVWYAGTESILGDFYTANMNASLISKPIDLTRMIPSNPVFLNFKYYGAAMPGDVITLYASTDNGVTWTDTTTTISGVTDFQGGAAWLYRIDNWVDFNHNGAIDANEYEYGLDISEYLGHQVMFKFTFKTGNTPSAPGFMGYYLDDFIVYGFEANNEIGLTSIDDIGTTHLNDTEAISGNFANLGTGTTPVLTARMLVYNTSGLADQEDQDINPIAAGASAKVTWNYQFKQTGDYWVDIELLPPAQGVDASSYDNKQERKVHVADVGAGVLLVDDDGGPTNSGRLHFWNYDVDTDDTVVTALESKGIAFDVTHVLFNSEGPDLAVLKSYHTVIWSTGWDGTGRSVLGTLGPSDRATLRQYLHDGGSLWLLSSETVYDLSVADPTFLRDTLHLTNYQDDAGFPATLNGVPGNEISNGWSFAGQSPIPGNDRTDSLSPGSGSQGTTYESENVQNPTTGPFNTVNYNGTCKIVYSAFDLTYIVHDKDRGTAAAAIMKWLYSGLTLELSTSTKSVDAGGSVNYTFTIKNHGSGNKTVRDLSVGSVTDGWNADITPTVSSGVPSVILHGYQALTGNLRVKAPLNAPPNAKGSATLTLVVNETGEVLTNHTTTIVRVTPRLNLTLSPKWQQGEAGQNSSYMVTVLNTGNIRTTVNLTVNGSIDTWASFETSFLTLEPGKEDGTVLTISVPPEAQAANYTLDVIAEGKYQSVTTKATDIVNLTVKQFRELEISSVRAPDGGRVDPATPSIEVIVELNNKGNGRDKVHVTLSATFIGEENWGWGDSTVNLPAFAKNFKTNLTLVLWNKADGGVYNITVMATSEDGKAQAQSYLIVTVLRPDLYLTQDGIVLDYDLVVGQEASFDVKVFNGGPVDSLAPNITVYDRSNEKIYTGKLSSAIKANGFEEITIKWTPVYKGPEELTFVVNEGKAIIENAYENNSITRSFIVYQPNLKVEESDILLYVNGREMNTITNGDQVSITVQVRNMDAYSYKVKGAVVEFYVDGVRIGNRTLDVSASNINYAKQDWTATKGSHAILIKVDPDNKITEQDEADNQASRQVSVRAKPVAPLTVDPMLILGAIVLAVIVLVVYGISRGVVPSPIRPSRVELSDKNYRCNECGKTIKQGTKYYHCTCGRKAHTKCAKRAELCECLRRVRIDE